MAKVYLSFLGTNDYLACTYYSGDKEVNNVRFVQEATLGLYCRNWTSDDRIIIFTTEEANKKNWQDNGHKNPCKGLERCIKDLNLDAPVKAVLVPIGKSEDEIWDIFRIVYESLNQEDEVIFDITHSFRSIPMLAIVILNYAKTMKNILLSGIYYGAFEVLGNPYEARELPQEKRQAPILDLTSFDQLMEWSFAIDRLLGAGDAAMVSKLANQSVKPILSESKGQNKAADTIRKIANNLSDFSKAMATCRGRDITTITEKLKENVNQFESLDLVQPFKPIFKRIKRQMDLFPGDNILDGMQAAKWCLEHNLIQQGYTILEETLVSYFIYKIGENPNNLSNQNRQIAKQAIKIFLYNLPQQKWHNPAGNNLKITNKFIKFYKTKNKLLKVYDNLREFRNDLNHAGYRINALGSDKFEKKLASIVDKIEAFILDDYK